ncbi:MAG: hypothetical protein IT374_23030 [Polyangiaceae bacterium]|nr:hypothetical protein [Polyangiaceae bacterium]
MSKSNRSILVLVAVLGSTFIGATCEPSGPAPGNMELRAGGRSEWRFNLDTPPGETTGKRSAIFLPPSQEGIGGTILSTALPVSRSLALRRGTASATARQNLSWNTEVDAYRVDLFAAADALAIKGYNYTFPYDNGGGVTSWLADINAAAPQFTAEEYTYTDAPTEIVQFFNNNTKSMTVARRGRCSNFVPWTDLFGELIQSVGSAIDCSVKDQGAIGASTRGVAYPIFEKDQFFATSEGRAPWLAGGFAFLFNTHIQTPFGAVNLDGSALGFYNILPNAVQNGVVVTESGTYFPEYFATTPQLESALGKAVVGDIPRSLTCGINHKLQQEIPDADQLLIGGTNCDGKPACGPPRACNPSLPSDVNACYLNAKRTLDVAVGALAPKPLTAAGRAAWFSDLRESDFVCEPNPTFDETAPDMAHGLCKIVLPVEHVNTYPDGFEFVFRENQSADGHDVMELLGLADATARATCDPDRISHAQGGVTTRQMSVAFQSGVGSVSCAPTLKPACIPPDIKP